MGERVIGRTSRPIVVIMITTLVLAVAVITVVGARSDRTGPPAGSHTGTARTGSGPDGGPLAIVAGGCLTGIGSARAGRLSFAITNRTDTPQEVTVYDRQHRYAYAEVEMIAPGVSRQLVAILPAGTFSIACEGDDGTVGYSDPFVVSGGPVAGVHRWIPASYADLANAVSRYRTAVDRGLRRLAADTDRLADAVGDHDRQLARRRWLTAHLDYARLGAAYGTFGEAADRIDGRPDGLPGGVDDPDFTGFHRLERLLWHGGSSGNRSRWRQPSITTCIVCSTTSRISSPRPTTSRCAPMRCWRTACSSS